MAALHHGVQPVLWRQQVFGVGGVQADAGDSPSIGDAPAGKVVEVDGLVCAVKVARADVDDTPAKGRPVIGWHVDTVRMQS